jgi:hypothetical protein
MAERNKRRACELAWQEPWQNDRGNLVLGADSTRSSERSLVVDSLQELLVQLRQISDKIHHRCGYWAAVSLEGLEEPALYATAAGDRWHFWYLANGGKVSLRSCGDEAAGGTTPVIFSEFDEMPDSELVSNKDGEQVLREWFEFKRLSDAIRWREFK